MHKRANRQIGCFIIFSFLMAACNVEALQYPETKRMARRYDYHGVKVEDPYYWLEDLECEETKTWVTSQNELSRPYLAGIPKRESIKKRITELWNYESYGIPKKQGGKYFYRRNDGLQNQSVLYVAKSINAAPRVLINPNVLRQDATISLKRYSVSPDGKYIAYTLSDGGSDWSYMKIREIETGKDLQDELGFIKYTNASWSKDSKGFYYSRYPGIPNGTDRKGDGAKPVSIYYHLIGTRQSADRPVYSMPDHPLWNPYGTVTNDGRYLTIFIEEGYSTNALYYLDLLQPGAKVVSLFDKWDAEYNFIGNKGAEFYVKTTRNAPLGRIVAVNIERPHPMKWLEIVPETEATLQKAGYIGGNFIAKYLKDAQTQVIVFDKEGKKLRTIDLPGVGSAFGFNGKPDDTETFYSFTSFTSPNAIYRYDIATGKSSLFAEAELNGIDSSEYETEQVFYRSKDGTRVPMFITHHRGLPLNGQNPTLLYGYGGFNVSLTPRFKVSQMVWLEMGGVLAIPNLRGGGEYGESWHLAGTKTNKQNVFDDCIAAAEWLIDKGYTSRSKLAVKGGSNGGLLVGACITQRPDLFGAALPAVGVLDMLRYHLTNANARSWASDYGLSENEDEFKALFAYSPYHNVKKRTCYPATLITTADHDDRVVPWHSFKFAAEMQNAQECSNPVIIRVETRAGHGAGTPTWMRIEKIADQLAFLTQALIMN